MLKWLFKFICLYLVSKCCKGLYALS